MRRHGASAAAFHKEQGLRQWSLPAGFVLKPMCPSITEIFEIRHCSRLWWIITAAMLHLLLSLLWSIILVIVKLMKTLAKLRALCASAATIIPARSGMFPSLDRSESMTTRLSVCLGSHSQSFEQTLLVWPRRPGCRAYAVEQVEIKGAVPLVGGARSFHGLGEIGGVRWVMDTTQPRGAGFCPPPLVFVCFLWVQVSEARACPLSQAVNEWMEETLCATQAYPAGIYYIVSMY